MSCRRHLFIIVIIIIGVIVGSTVITRQLFYLIVEGMSSCLPCCSKQLRSLYQSVVSLASQVVHKAPDWPMFSVKVMANPQSLLSSLQVLYKQGSLGIQGVIKKPPFWEIVIARDFYLILSHVYCLYALFNKMSFVIMKCCFLLYCDEPQVSLKILSSQPGRRW